MLTVMLVVIAALGLLAASRAAEAQHAPRKYRIWVLTPLPVPSSGTLLVDSVCLAPAPSGPIVAS
jgi:hypothetical protein